MRVLALGTARLSTSARPVVSTTGAADTPLLSSVTVPPPPLSPLPPGLPGSLPLRGGSGVARVSAATAGPGERERGSNTGRMQQAARRGDPLHAPPPRPLRWRVASQAAPRPGGDSVAYL